MMEYSWVGIDPGKSGAMVVLFSDDSMLVYDLSECYDGSGAAQTSINPVKFRDLVVDNFGVLLEEKEVLVCCEKPIFVGGGFTIKTPMSMFESYGVIRTVFESVGVGFKGIRPRDWIRFYPDLYHPKQKRDKSESIVKAKELFPDSSDMFEYTVLKGRYKGTIIGLDGRAEAALIANYARSLHFTVDSFEDKELSDE